jgi:predicted CXXCH cytochrome family protein
LSKQDKKKGERVMKKYILVCLAIGLMLAYASLAMAVNMSAEQNINPGTSIKKTSHDLSSLGAAAQFGDDNEKNGQNRICIYCHTPHFSIVADDVLTYMPLWNHDVTASVFTPYSNGTDLPNSAQHQSFAMANSNGPGGPSILCLSCHDGTVATNAYGVQADLKSTGTRKYMTGSTYANLGTDLQNHHPIGFDWPTTVQDDEIAPTTTGVNGKGGLAAGVTINELLWNGRMECTSCHDVHNTKNAGYAFTWVKDTNSALCLTCHLK